MNVITDSTAPDAPSIARDTVRIQLHGRSVRRLGHWTTAHRFVVRAARGSVTLDLRSPRIEARGIEVDLDLDRAMVKLLVPDDAAVDLDRVRRAGRCGFVDWSGSPAPGGRVVRISGQ